MVDDNTTVTALVHDLKISVVRMDEFVIRMDKALNDHESRIRDIERRENLEKNMGKDVNMLHSKIRELCQDRKECMNRFDLVSKDLVSLKSFKSIAWFLATSQITIAALVVYRMLNGG